MNWEVVKVVAAWVVAMYFCYYIIIVRDEVKEQKKNELERLKRTQQP